MLVLHCAWSNPPSWDSRWRNKMKKWKRLGREGKREILFEHVSTKSCWKCWCNEAARLLILKCRDEIAQLQISFVTKAMRVWTTRLNENKIKKLPQILHTAKSCIPLGKTSVCSMSQPPICSMSQPPILSRELSYSCTQRLSPRHNLALTFGTDVESYHNPEKNNNNAEWIDIKIAT